jgi:hypothetical protein
VQLVTRKWLFLGFGLLALAGVWVWLALEVSSSRDRGPDVSTGADEEALAAPRRPVRPRSPVAEAPALAGEGGI